MSILIKSFKEDGYSPITHIRLSEEEYSRALSCFTPVCTDVVPIDVDRKNIYLARRSSKPMTGWWWIGGRMLPSDTKEQSVARNFKRETKLKISQNRFRLVGVLDYRWKDRAQSPQGVGCHMLAYTFTLELTEKEIASLTGNLDKDEYEAGTGLIAFNREQLVKEEVFPAIINLYDHIFSQK